MTYRLPAEAEWERAARGGREGELYAGGNDADAVAWTLENAGGTTHPECGGTRNGYGFFGMSGNVWEWVQNAYTADYTAPPADGTAWERGTARVVRGGGWGDTASGARVAYRTSAPPSFAYSGYGFRLAMTTIP